MATPNIRAAIRSDANAIAALSAELGYPVDAEEVASILATMAASGEHEVFVAEQAAGGKVVGWIHVFAALRLASGPFAELGGLVVAEEYRRQGLGRALAARAEEWAMASGLGRVRLRSRHSRTDAHKFYELLGYAPVKTQLVFDKSLAKKHESNDSSL